MSYAVDAVGALHIQSMWESEARSFYESCVDVIGSLGTVSTGFNHPKGLWEWGFLRPLQNL